MIPCSMVDVTNMTNTCIAGKVKGQDCLHSKWLDFYSFFLVWLLSLRGSTVYVCTPANYNHRLDWALGTFRLLSSASHVTKLISQSIKIQYKIAEIKTIMKGNGLLLVPFSINVSSSAVGDKNSLNDDLPLSVFTSANKTAVLIWIALDTSWSS